MIAVVEVGYTTHRPVRPDEHTAWYVVAAESETDATLLAAQWNASRKHRDHLPQWVDHRPGAKIEMPTSARVVDLMEV